MHGFQQTGWLHHFPMHEYGTLPFLPALLRRADGVRVMDGNGKWYIDAISGCYCVNVGYGRRDIISASARASRQVHYVSPFMAAHPGLIALTECLAVKARKLMGDAARVLFMNSGSEAVDTAIKLARAYNHRMGNKRTKIITGKHAYHGCTYGALSGSEDSDPAREYAPLVGNVERLISAAQHRQSRRSSASTLPSESALREAAAILIEPIEQCSGTGLPESTFGAHLTALTRKNDVLLIVDEVLTGFGRTGRLFASEALGLEPDILVCGKGLTSGYEALSAVIVRRDIAEVFSRKSAPVFAHGSTFAARPSATAAAIKNLDILDREGLIQRSATMEAEMRRALAPIKRLRQVRDVRGRGMLFSIDLDPAHFPNAAKLQALRAAIFRSGIICTMFMTATDPFIDIAPPFITSRSDIDTIATAIGEAIDHAGAANG